MTEIEPRVTAEEYQRKKAKMLNEKRELKEALGEIERGSGGWLEPAKAFLTTCHEASSVAWQENPAAAKPFLKTVGSNFTLNHRKLCVTYGLPFGLVAQTDARNEWLAGLMAGLRSARLSPTGGLMARAAGRTLSPTLSCLGESSIRSSAHASSVLRW